MTIRATQPISSRFGTYMPGDPIEESAVPVLEAWIAAGIAVEEPEEETVAEKREPPKRTSDVEQATARKPERAVSRRMQTANTPQPPHRRFVQKAEE